ncbi:inositol monophosphatase family protein [Paenibacillus sp.]|uniref:inositol monophosphatase family protein n=1 Tax=Paenibacillus sp. TaxID=58172 RepID=UPI00281189E9|nr:inositol monophosphatase family protein [Paenibacillus sp.]
MGNTDYLEQALDIALTAGTMIKSRISDGSLIFQKSSAYDLVTEVDQAAEHLIRNHLYEKFPTHRVLGEEGGVSCEQPLDIQSEPYLWVVDPIDGTNNFINGLPGYTVSIALIRYGVIQLGVVYDPTIQEMFWAVLGKGAFLNGRRIQVSPVQSLDDSIIGTGFPSNIASDRPHMLNQVQNIRDCCRNIRIYGSAALQLAYVASGRLNATWDLSLQLWDIAAGALIVQESGGVVSEVDGRDFHLSTRNILASNKELHSLLVKKLNHSDG